MNKNYYYLFLLLFCGTISFAQTNIVTYTGNAGKVTFYDVMQISDGTFIVSGYADNLDWIPSNVVKTQ